VDSGSLIWVDRNGCSVNSRQIGERVKARLCPDRTEVWYALGVGQISLGSSSSAWVTGTELITNSFHELLICKRISATRAAGPICARRSLLFFQRLFDVDQGLLLRGARLAYDYPPQKRALQADEVEARVAGATTLSDARNWKAPIRLAVPPNPW